MKLFNKEQATVIAFALLHAVVTIISRWQGLTDDLMLTTLTMLMAIVLCQIKQTNVNTMIMILIIVNFGGFYLGKYIGSFIRLFISDTYIRGGITTFLTTVIIGYVVSVIVSWTKKRNIIQNRHISTYWLLMAYTIIIIARMLLILIGDEVLYGTNTSLNVIIDYTFCCVAQFYLAVSAVKEAMEAQRAKEASSIAQYNYIRLQQQVKPHFMFNNLNILNSLICENQAKEASDFVYKLAYIYRYMIENENEKLVPLTEEIDFAKKYIDLMKVRFESSFDVSIDIEPRLMSSLVVPSSVQMLIENAIKHNGGTDDIPLRIRIFNTKTHLVIWNNRLVKSSSEPSIHFGLKYIKQLYGNISSSQVEVESGDEEFVVKLPIIN